MQKVYLGKGFGSVSKFSHGNLSLKPSLMLNTHSIPSTTRFTLVIQQAILEVPVLYRHFTSIFSLFSCVTSKSSNNNKNKKIKRHSPLDVKGVLTYLGSR